VLFPAVRGHRALTEHLYHDHLAPVRSGAVLKNLTQVAHLDKLLVSCYVTKQGGGGTYIDSMAVQKTLQSKRALRPLAVGWLASSLMCPHKLRDDDLPSFLCHQLHGLDMKC
jgi:hypothetical protein